jgi:hypothetical protein
MIGLRGRYNERGEFLITTTPPVNEATQATAGGLYFPHIVDSGGYTTQFVLFSGLAGQSSTGNLELFSQNGQTLNWPLDSSGVTFPPKPSGSVSNVVPFNTCPAGYNCVSFTVTCQDIVSITGKLAIGPAASATRGIAVFFTGGAGTEYYSDYQDVAGWMQGLRDSGVGIVQVKWDRNWWGHSSNLKAGLVNQSCRPATIIKYIHQTYYAPLGMGRKAFILTGNSAGSSQIAYSLAYYGLENIIDVAVLSAGPPHSALHKSCMNSLAEEDYWFNSSKRSEVDDSYGIRDNGPCLLSDSRWIPTWISDSVAYSGYDYHYPNTLVHQIIGAQDPKMIATAGDYRERIVQAGTPHSKWQVVPNTPHAVFETREGRDAIGQVILQSLQ